MWRSQTLGSNRGHAFYYDYPSDNLMEHTSTKGATKGLGCLLFVELQECTQYKLCHVARKSMVHRREWHLGIGLSVQQLSDR
ncbi:hypothetical protein CI238_02173 [Colletotrichum incanum]|uniref:Uncharacterized protein n=1 Tax=Colletotrichum incanum TaxID=1573173 RepID=A0A162PCQ4_COLIC|nr:hypothetical protein CI238_02173 [Colletotrichum incanum]